MLIVRAKILFLLNLFCLVGFGQNFNFVKVLPGKGIVYNNDSILLFRTSIKETCKILKIKDETDSGNVCITYWDGMDTGGSEFSQIVLFKSIVFEFASPDSVNKLKLRSVLTYNDKFLKIYTDSGLEIGRINPKIKEIYPFRNTCDTISKNFNEGMTYKLCSYGISFKLGRTENNELQLIEIKIYDKIK